MEKGNLANLHTQMSYFLGKIKSFVNPKQYAVCLQP